MKDEYFNKIVEMSERAYQTVDSDNAYATIASAIDGWEKHRYLTASQARLLRYHNNRLYEETIDKGAEL